MKKNDWHKHFQKKYPKIIGKIFLECGTGWFPLIDILCKHLQFHIDNNWGPQLHAVQIKEKYGGLRFYVDSTTAEQFGAIQLAEDMSYHICENCGTMDDVHTNNKGWISTLCNKCRKQKEEI